MHPHCPACIAFKFYRHQNPIFSRDHSLCPATLHSTSRAKIDRLTLVRIHAVIYRSFSESGYRSRNSKSLASGTSKKNFFLIEDCEAM